MISKNNCLWQDTINKLQGKSIFENTADSGLLTLIASDSNQYEK